MWWQRNYGVQVTYAKKRGKKGFKDMDSSFYERREAKRLKQKEKKELARTLKEQRRLEAIKELELEFSQYQKSFRCERNGTNDQKLVDAVSKGLNAEVESMLLDNTATSLSQASLNESLIIAADNGYKLILIYLLKAGANKSWTDLDGNTPLMICAKHGYLDILKILIANNADINAINKEGDTALLLSLKQCGSSEMTRLLVSATNVNLKNLNGVTALMRSIEFSDIESMKILTLNEANVYEENKDGETVLDLAKRKCLGNFVDIFLDCKMFNLPTLIAAIQCKDITLIETVLMYETKCVKQKSSLGKTALEVLFDSILGDEREITAEEKNIVRLLITKGVDVKKQVIGRSKKNKFNVNNVSPLVKAVQIGDVDVVRWMCAKGPVINEDVDYHQLNPLMMAARGGFIDIINYLLSKQADIDVSGHEGTALDIAIKYEKWDCAKKLLEEKAKKNLNDAYKLAIKFNNVSLFEHLVDNFKTEFSDGQYLKFTIESGSKDIFQFLIQNGLDVNMQIFDSQRFSYQIPNYSCPIHLAVKYVQLDILEIIINNNADINIIDSNGDTGLLLACNIYSIPISIINILLQAGADVNIINKRNETALSVSLSKSAAITEMLLLKKAKFHSIFLCQKGAHLLMAGRALKLIPLALGLGIYPHFDLYNGGHAWFNFCNEKEYVSPLERALKDKHMFAANVFISSRFLMRYDVTDLLKKDCFQNTILKSEQGNIFNNLLSLSTLCFVQISDLLGATLDREEKVKTLPIPEKIQRQLLFRS